VVDFLNSLRDNTSFAEGLETIKLQGLQRAESRGEEEQRMFGIEGVSKPREMQ
jgi:hypothetical protein